MRVSPLGIFGWKMEPESLAKLAAEDAAITHPKRICQQVNGLYATAIADAVREGLALNALHERISARAVQWNIDHAIHDRIGEAETRRSPEYYDKMGWVLTGVPERTLRTPARPDARGRSHRNGALRGSTPTRTAPSAEHCSGRCTGATPCRDSGWTASSSAGPRPRRRSRDRKNTGLTTR